MITKIFLTAILSIAMSVAAQFMLKAGMTGSAVKSALAEPFGMRVLSTIFFDKFIIGGFLLYGIGAVVWLSVLSRWDVSKAYPMVGIGFAFTAIVGAVMGEQISLLRAAGIVLIITGVVFVARS